MISLTFSKTEVDSFRHTNPTLRYGQAFHQHMKLEKVQGPAKNWCDRLYSASDRIAKDMIRKQTDVTQ